jgi:lipopolysaccharide biosynthesis glycosyltransferase
MDKQIPVFVGYDGREAVAYSVFCHSVLSRTKAQVSFIPLCGDQEPGSSNRFNKIRFEIAERLGFKGWGIWADGDMLCRADIEEAWDLREKHYDVMVVKHEYSTKHPIKFLGQANEDYPRKNWSSFMLVNAGNYPWRKITKEYVAQAKPSHLHRFEFLKDERIGDLPKEWNWLVSEYEFNPQAKLAHFTVGSPCWPQYSKCDYADEWRSELRQVNHFEPWVESYDDSPMVSER